MLKSIPDYQDADLVLRLYEMRREALMRESRNIVGGKFFPKTFDDIKEVIAPEHPFNAAYRQVSSYWEMVFGLAKHGIVNADYLVENSVEGLFLFAKVHPFLEQFRAELFPLAFQNVEWAVNNCEAGKKYFAFVQARIQKIMESK